MVILCQTVLEKYDCLTLRRTSNDERTTADVIGQTVRAHIWRNYYKLSFDEYGMYILTCILYCDLQTILNCFYHVADNEEHELVPLEPDSGNFERQLGPTGNLRNFMFGAELTEVITIFYTEPGELKNSAESARTRTGYS